MAGVRYVLMFNWYPVPLTPFLCILIMTAAGGLAAELRSRAGSTGVTILAACMLLAQVDQLNLGRDGTLRFLTPREGAWWREAGYAAICRAFAGEWQPGTVVASLEVGTLGYFCPVTILDTIGLVSPGLAGYYPVQDDQAVGQYAIPPTLIAARRPDYVVTLDVFVRRSLLRDPAFLRDYQQVMRLDIEGGGSILVFQRLPRLSG